MANTKARKRKQREALKIDREVNANAELAKKRVRADVGAKSSIIKQRMKRTVANSKPNTDVTPGPKTEKAKTPTAGGVEKAMGHAADTKKLRQVQADTKLVKRAETIKGLKTAGKGLGVAGAVAGLGLMSANMSKFKQAGMSGKASYAGAGATFNGATPEQAEAIARSVDMLKNKKGTEKKAAPKPEQKTTAAPAAKPAEKPKAAQKAAPAKPAAKPAPQKTEKKPEKKTEGFPVYKKDSAEAGSFRSAFAAARKSGAKEFTWQGRKYNTKIKK